MRRDHAGERLVRRRPGALARPRLHRREEDLASPRASVPAAARNPLWATATVTPSARAATAATAIVPHAIQVAGFRVINAMLARGEHEPGHRTSSPGRRRYPSLAEALPPASPLRYGRPRMDPKAVPLRARPKATGRVVALTGAASFLGRNLVGVLRRTRTPRASSPST